MNKHLKSCGLLVAASLLTLASCNKANKNVINFWTGFGQSMTTALENVLADYKEQGLLKEGYDVVHTGQGGYDNLLSNITGSVSTRSYPQIAVAYPDHMAQYEESKILTDLSNFIERDGVKLDSYYQDYLQECKEVKEGAISGLPFNKSTEVLTTNKTFVEVLIALTASKTGDDKITGVPQTWQEVDKFGTAAIKVLKELGAFNKIIMKNEAGEYKVFADKVSGETAGYVTVIDLTAVGENDFRVLSWDSQANYFITGVRQWNGVYTELTTDAKGNKVQTKTTKYARRDEGEFLLDKDGKQIIESQVIENTTPEGKLTSKQTFKLNKETGKMELGTETRYNDEGQIVSEKVFGKKADIITEYDPETHKPIREIEFNNKENRAHYVYEEMSENGRWTKKTFFDRKGRITSKYEVDGTSGKEKRIEYFDKKGRTTEVIEYDAAEDVTKHTCLRKNGTLESTIEYNNGTETKRTYYDKKGKVKKVEKWNAEKEKWETAEFKDASDAIELAEAPKDPKLSPRGLRIAKRELKRALKKIEKSDDEAKFNAILENIKKKGNAEQQKELTQMVNERKAALAEAEKKATKAPEKSETPEKKPAAESEKPAESEPKVKKGLIWDKTVDENGNTVKTRTTLFTGEKVTKVIDPQGRLISKTFYNKTGFKITEEYKYNNGKRELAKKHIWDDTNENRIFKTEEYSMNGKNKVTKITEYGYESDGTQFIDGITIEETGPNGKLLKRSYLNSEEELYLETEFDDVNEVPSKQVLYDDGKIEVNTEWDPNYKTPGKKMVFDNDGWIEYAWQKQDNGFWDWVPVDWKGKTERTVDIPERPANARGAKPVAESSSNPPVAEEPIELPNIFEEEPKPEFSNPFVEEPIKPAFSEKGGVKIPEGFKQTPDECTALNGEKLRMVRKGGGTGFNSEIELRSNDGTIGVRLEFSGNSPVYRIEITNGEPRVYTNWDSATNSWLEQADPTIEPYKGHIAKMLEFLNH